MGAHDRGTSVPGGGVPGGGVQVRRTWSGWVLGQSAEYPARRYGTAARNMNTPKITRWTPP